MTDLIRDYLPDAPKLGLYRAPNLPADKVRAALRDYGVGVHPDEVLALYDATRLGSAKDGALFLADRLVFQNNDFEPPQTVRYADVVRVDAKRQLLGGRKVVLDVNEARATVTHELDFSARGEAAEYVARFLHEAMLASARREDPRAERGEAETDGAAVAEALAALVREGKLTEPDRRRMLAALDRG